MTKKIIHYTVCFMICVVLTSIWFTFTPKPTKAIRVIVEEKLETLEFSVCGEWIKAEVIDENL